MMAPEHDRLDSTFSFETQWHCLELRLRDLHRDLKLCADFQNELSEGHGVAFWLRDLGLLCARREDRTLGWMLHSAVAGCYPDVESNHDFYSHLRNLSQDSSLRPLLICAAVTYMRSQLPAKGVQLVENQFLVDASIAYQDGLDTSLTNDLARRASNTGFALIRWDAKGGYLSLISSSELHGTAHKAKRIRQVGVGGLLLLPRQTTLLFPDLLGNAASLGMSTVALDTDNKCIAIVDLPRREANDRGTHATEISRQTKYFSAIKYFSAVIPTSQSAFDYYSGFVSMLPAQGLTGPDILDFVESHSQSPKGSRSTRQGSNLSSDFFERVLARIHE